MLYCGTKIYLMLLTILSKTNLPDKGIIYLCKDEKSNPITILLIDDIKCICMLNRNVF
jgi:hypothetical protein